MASDDDKRFDQVQFERILRRAIDLEADRGDLMFSEHDVIAAGRELGVDEAATRAAVRELYGETKIELDPPAGTDIVVEVADGALRVTAPPLPVTAARIAHILFLVGWLTFVGSFTAAMGRISLLLACLGLPFCVIGVSAIARALRQVAEWTELRLTPDEGLLSWRVGPFQRSAALETRKLRLDVRGSDARHAPGQADFVATHIELQHVGRRFTLLAERTPAEIAWIASRLRSWLSP